MKKSSIRALLSMLSITPLSFGLLHAQEAASNDDGVIVLEEFIVKESAASLNNTILPTDREISGLFNDSTSITEVPRSVTLISPKMMEEFNIDGLDDLQKIGAGTQTNNYYGVAGAPTIRGVKGGTYLNGMLRAFNRNEMPLSFGSLEAIEVVKGPAPADFSPTLIGGFVNLIPKSPYFDESRGSIAFEFDNWGKKKVTADYGAPFLLPGETPAAFRVSITSQQGDSYYDDLSNDYTSVYGAIKFRPKDGVSIFVGGEYFDYQSNENPGWNRPTQELIDSDQYVIGEPLDATNARSFGVADRALIYDDQRLALTEDVALALVPQFGDISLMEFVADDNGVAKYVYTQAYFDAGGQAVTQKIEGSDVLTDPSDFADSTDIVLFGDIIFDSDPDRTFTVKNLFEHVETEKNSSYGYAFESEQTLFATKAFITDRELIPLTSFTYGLSARYTEALQRQDFWDEPFSRRDISQNEISSNSIILAGAQAPVGDINYWGGGFGGIGGNNQSELLQLAAFVSGNTKLLDDRLTILTSLRYEYADFDISVPSGIGGVTQAARDARAEDSDDTEFLNRSIGVNFELIDGLFLYANLQKGTSMDPTQSGVVVGENNFSRNELWEVGIKTSFFNDKLFTSLAYYEWEQSSFNGRTGSSEALEGEGIELEATFIATENLSIIASYTWQEIKRLDPLGFRTIPFSEQDWALYGGVLNSNFSDASFDGRDRYGDNFGTPPDNEELVYAGAPQTAFKLYAIYDFLNGFSVSGGAVYQEEFYLDFDNQIELPDSLVWSLNTRYATDTWELGLSIENLTDEEYFLGSDPTFGANTLVTKAPERTFLVSFKYKF